VEKYKGFLVPPHKKPGNEAAVDYCVKSICFAKTDAQCMRCLFFCDQGEDRPEFKEWLKEKEQNGKV
jgi:hypothetical protein